jgi:hypothetical protein
MQNPGTSERQWRRMGLKSMALDLSETMRHCAGKVLGANFLRTLGVLFQDGEARHR